MSYCPKNKTQASSSEKGSKHRYGLLPGRAPWGFRDLLSTLSLGLAGREKGEETHFACLHTQNTLPALAEPRGGSYTFGT